MTTSEPTTGEIVMALRNCLNVGCEECILHETEITPERKSHYCGAPTMLADRLESQERIIADKDAKIATLTEKADAMENDLINLDMNLTEMTARAEQAEAREKAAIADMKLIVDNVRETHCDETCCFACKYDCDTSITDSGCYANECPGFERDDCFEWRGPQEAREGE